MAKNETKSNENAIERAEIMRSMAESAMEIRNQEKVTIMLPLTSEKEGDVFVAVNGATYQIKRGEEVQVPKSVYKVLINQQRQDTESLKRSKALSDAFRNRRY